MTQIDLNLDAGESVDRLTDGSEPALYDLVSSVNVACGGHAGDEATMARVAELAAAKGLAVGPIQVFRQKKFWATRAQPAPHRASGFTVRANRDFVEHTSADGFKADAH